jgi:hypothetical protein
LAGAELALRSSENRPLLVRMSRMFFVVKATALPGVTKFV